MEEKKSKQHRYYERNKEAISLKNKKRYEQNKEKAKEYYEENKEKFKQYYKDNIESIQEKRTLNRDKKNAYSKNRYPLIKEEKLKYNKKYISERMKTDPIFKFKRSIRSIIYNAITKNGGEKLTRTEIILGCSFEEFRLYLESKFEPWMSWENYGNWNGIATEINISWDIDHIIPMATANNEFDIIKLNHYTNLQPLCSYTNRHIKKFHIT